MNTITMKKTFLCICIMLFLPMILHAQKKTDANITGHVVNARTKEHIPFMNVMLKGTTIGTTTDATGHFLITHCPEGKFILVAQGIGYKKVEHEVVLENKKTVEIKFEAEEDATDLEQVVVSANRVETSRKTAPTIVNVVMPEQFENTNSHDLSQAVKFETGVRVENNCQNCGTSAIRINGLEGAYSQILIDSRPLMSSLAGVYGIEQIPAAMIDRIEIVRGGGSAIFGSNAIAGTINVITKEPARNFGSISHTTNLMGGNTADFVNSFNASVISDNYKTGLYIFGQNRHRDPYDRDGDGFSEISKLNNRTLGFRGFLRTSAYSKLSVEYHNLHEFRRGGDHLDLPPHQAIIAEQAQHDIHAGSAKFDLFSKNGKHHLSIFTSAEYLHRDSYYGDRSGDTTVWGNAYGYSSDVTASSGLQYNYNFSKLWFLPAELTLGVEHSFDRLKDENLNYREPIDQTINILSAYAQNEWKNNMWSILIGARIDKHSMVDAPVISPRANLRFNPNDHVNLRLSYSSGFRAPQIFDEELHVGAVQGNVYIITNSKDLKMERSHSVSGSTDLYFRIGEMDANFLLEGFYTRINDAFVNEPLFIDSTTGINHYERRNKDGAEIRGVNAEFCLIPLHDMKLQLGATYQKSTFVGEGEEWKEGTFEKRISRTPDLYAYLTATYKPVENFKIALSGTYTGDMIVYHTLPGDVVEQVKTDHFVDINFRLSYNFAFGKQNSLEIYAGVQNILDSFQKDFDKGMFRDSGFIYGPVLPRTFFAGVKFSL